MLTIKKSVFADISKIRLPLLTRPEPKWQQYLISRDAIKRVSVLFLD